MKILVACEESGAVRRALRSRGHDAWSVDLLPASDWGPGLPLGFHIKGDALEVANALEWDAIIAFPPCTHFAGSGARWLTDHWVTAKRAPGGRYWWDGSAKRAAQKESLEFVLDLWAAIQRAGKGAIENPRGMLSTLWRKPNQEVQPFHHGHAEWKTTGLWLHNLPKLVPTNFLPPPYAQRIWKMPPGPDRAKERSKTYPGIAAAMADQWFGRVA